GFEVPRRAPLSMADGAKLPGPGRGFNPALVAGALGIYMLVVVISFFKGAAWAGSVLPKPGVVPNSLAELARRLEAINQLDVPYRIERGAQPNEFFATWHYADAKWLDLARARGMKRTFRIRLVLDEKEHVVRATDFNSALDWSAGSGGMAVNWKSTAGIVFFQQDYQRVFGL